LATNVNKLTPDIEFILQILSGKFLSPKIRMIIHVLGRMIIYDLRSAKKKLFNTKWFSLCDDFLTENLVTLYKNDALVE
jgi:hypothetical protein